MASRSTECEHCGYDLSGLVASDAVLACPEPTCPECGNPFRHYDPWIRRPWPRWHVLAWRFTIPTLAFWFVIGLLSLVWWGRILLIVYAILLVPCWLVISCLLPFWDAAHLADRLAIKPRRPRLTLAISTVAIFTNIGVSLLCLWLTLQLR